MTAPLRVVIADDEPLARQRLRRLLRLEPGMVVVGECADGADAAATVLREAPDLLLLDVQMPGLDGFAVLRSLPAAAIPVTIFVTAFDRYALQAFEARAIDYLLKPFTESRFRSALERARSLVGRPDTSDRAELLALVEQLRREVSALAGADAQADRLVVREKGRVIVVPLEDVDYLEAARNHVRIHAGRSVHLVRDTLGALEQRLAGARFARIHRSTLVNLDRVAELRPWFSGDAIVVLQDGRKLRLSRGYRPAVEERLEGGRTQRAAPGRSASELEQPRP